MGRHSDMNGSTAVQQPSKINQKATTEQIRFAKLTQDGRQGGGSEDVGLSDKVKQVMELTRCHEATAQVALHDCDNDVNQAVSRVFDNKEQQTPDEWIEQTKKGTKKKAVMKSTSNDRHSQQHNDKYSHKNARANHNHVPKYNNNHVDEVPAADQDTEQVVPGQDYRKGFNRRGGNANNNGYQTRGQSMHENQQPPRFRGRGGMRGAGADRGRERRERTTDGASFDMETAETDQTGGHNEFAEHNGNGRGRRGNYTADRATRGSRGGRGRGRGGGHVHSDRGTFNANMDQWTDNTWDNSMAGQDTTEETVVDESAAVAPGSASAAAPNLWSNSMAAHISRKHQQQQQAAHAAATRPTNGVAAQPASDKWTGSQAQTAAPTSAVPHTTVTNSSEDAWANAAADDEWANKSLVFESSRMAKSPQQYSAKSPKPNELDTTNSSNASTAGGASASKQSYFRQQSDTGDMAYESGGATASPSADSWAATQQLKSDLGIGQAPLQQRQPRHPVASTPNNVSMAPTPVTNNMQHSNQHMLGNHVDNEQQQRVVEFSDGLGVSQNGGSMGYQFGSFDPSPPSQQQNAVVGAPSIEQFSAISGNVDQGYAQRTPQKTEQEQLSNAMSALSTSVERNQQQQAGQQQSLGGKQQERSASNTPQHNTQLSQSQQFPQPPPSNVVTSQLFPVTSNSNYQQSSQQPQQPSAPTIAGPVPTQSQSSQSQPMSVPNNSYNMDTQHDYMQQTQVHAQHRSTNTDVQSSSGLPLSTPGAGVRSNTSSLSNLQASQQQSAQNQNLYNAQQASAQAQQQQMPFNYAYAAPASYMPAFPSPIAANSVNEHAAAIQQLMAATPNYNTNWLPNAAMMGGIEMPFWQQQVPPNVAASAAAAAASQQPSSRSDAFGSAAQQLDYYNATAGGAGGTPVSSITPAVSSNELNKLLRSNVDLAQQTQHNHNNVPPPPGFNAPSASNAAVAQAALMGGNQFNLPMSQMMSLGYGTYPQLMMPPVSNAQTNAMQFQKQQQPYFHNQGFDDVQSGLANQQSHTLQHSNNDFVKQQAQQQQQQTQQFNQQSVTQQVAKSMMTGTEQSKPKYNPAVMMEKQQQQFGTPPPGLGGHQHQVNQVTQFGYAQNSYPMLSPGIMNGPPPHMQMAERNQVVAAAAAMTSQQHQQHRNNASGTNKLQQQPGYPNYNWNTTQLN